jgi:hypothetical protein
VRQWKWKNNDKMVLQVIGIGNVKSFECRCVQALEIVKVNHAFECALLREYYRKLFFKNILSLYSTV